MIAQRPTEGLSMDPRDIGPTNGKPEVSDIPSRGANRFPAVQEGDPSGETTTTLAGSAAKPPRIGNPLYVNTGETTPGNSPFIASKNLGKALEQARESQKSQEDLPASEQYVPPKKNPAYFQGDTGVSKDNLVALKEYQRSIAPEEK